MTPGSETKHVVVGTAGHVDHGKTTLIRAMTGINPDRLKEEQERGLTIDLGFAFLYPPSGRQVGIVDVPGHERFLKNMLAGASGVDIALLVVAADEGVMPQTREHLEILELLETRHGVVALTKCDLADEEWLEVVEDDLRNALKDTFLSSAKVIRVSAVTGQGVEELASEIDRLAGEAEQRSPEGPFRLPVDRAFTVTGFGTVITGTLVSGTLKTGDAIRVLPRGLDSRVRQIQVHRKKQEKVYAGTRVAVNLAGIEVDDLERGDVLLPPGYLQATRTLDAAVRVLEESPQPLRNRTRIRLHIGTAEVIGRVAILGAQEIEPGSSGFAQLRLEKPVTAARGDRFVLRLYSPMRILGGGVVLDPASGKHRASEKGVVERLERKLKGDPVDIVEDTLSLQDTGAVKEDLAHRTGLTVAEVDAALTQLQTEGKALRTNGRFLHTAAYERLEAKAQSVLESYHANYSMRPGMPKEEMRAQFGPKMEQKVFQSLLSMMASGGRLVISETMVRLPEHRPTLTPQQERLAESIEKDYRQAAMNPPVMTEVEQRYGADSREVVELLIERGELIRVAPDMQFHREAIDRAEKALREYLEANREIAVAQFRDLVGSSRKYVVPLLGYFDDKKVTRRVGDMRTLFR